MPTRASDPGNLRQQAQDADLLERSARIMLNKGSTLHGVLLRVVDYLRNPVVLIQRRYDPASSDSIRYASVVLPQDWDRDFSAPPRVWYSRSNKTKLTWGPPWPHSIKYMHTAHIQNALRLVQRKATLKQLSKGEKLKVCELLYELARRDSNPIDPWGPPA